MDGPSFNDFQLIIKWLAEFCSFVWTSFYSMGILGRFLALFPIVSFIVSLLISSFRGPNSDGRG